MLEADAEAEGEETPRPRPRRRPTRKRSRTSSRSRPRPRRPPRAAGAAVGAAEAEPEETPAPAPAPRRRRGAGERRDLVVRAQAKYVRSSARKARLVCDNIRGKSVEERELSWLTRRVRSRATGASCSSRRLPTLSTTTSSWARTSTSRRSTPTRVRRSGGSGRARWAARRGSASGPAISRSCSRRRTSHRHGSKSSSRGSPRGLHPRLEVELVQRALSSRTSCTRTPRSASTSSAGSRTPACRTSRSARTPPRSRSTSTRRGQGS